MSSSRKTPYYNLSQFDDHDKPSWRGDYSGDMNKIDTGMQEVKTSAIDAKTAAQNAQTSANNSLEYLAAMGVDSTQDGTGMLNRIETMDTRIATNTSIAAAFGINTIQDANNLKTSIDQRNQNVDDELGKKANKTDVYPKSDVYTKHESDMRFAHTGGHMHIVLFGDSWTQVEGKALQDGLETSGATVRNYGVSGAVMQDISGQIDRYVADASYDKSTVTHVAIVAGTNNVYFADRSITDTQLQALGEKIHSVFGTIPVHYFPNNSCTINGGRNNTYKNIIQIMRLYTVVHTDMFNIVMFSGGTWFKGTDVNGVQHLTSAGYVKLGQHMAQMMQGANFDNVLGDKAVGISAGSGSEVTFPSTTLNVCFNRFYTHVYGTISDVVVSGTNHSPKLVIDFNHGDTGSNLLPMRLFSDYTSIYCDDGNSIRGYFNGTSFVSGNNVDIGNNGYHPGKITVDAMLPHNDWLEKM